MKTKIDAVSNVDALAALYVYNDDDPPVRPLGEFPTPPSSQEKIMIEVLMWICVIVAVASGVAAITPTPKDDHWFRHVYMLVDWCALNIWKAKDK